jgi:hypothetical protein
MTSVKGKFITLACSLLESKQDVKEKVIKKVQEMTGKNFKDLAPESWVDTKVLQAIFKTIEENTNALNARASIKLIGSKVYPTIEKTTGLPKEKIKTPLDFVKFEAQGFLMNHHGSDVKPRKIKEAVNGKVVVEATSPGYDCVFIEGVYLGILKMCNVSNESVIQGKCIKKGDPVCEYHISWKIS